jgi:hypothetical protein
MRIEIIYYEVKRKEFRKKKTLVAFLKGKRRDEIIQAAELKGRTRKLKMLPEHLYNFDWEGK